MATLTGEWKSYASASFSSGSATITFYLEAKRGNSNIANNTTPVYTRLRSAFTSGNSLAGAGYKFTCTYASTVSGSGNWRFENEVITSGSSTVTHNSDGTKSITLKASAYNKYWGFTKNLSATVSLPKINRLASITSAPNFTDEDNPTIKYSNPAGNSVTGLKASIYMPDALTGLAYYRDIPKTGSSYTFNLTEEERERLRNNCKNSNSTTVRFYIRTIYGSNGYNNNMAKTLTIVNANPTMTYTKVENNSQVINYLGSSSADTVIKNISNVTISITPTTYKSATVSSVIINHNGVNITATESEGVYSATFDITGNTTTITTKDSRGNIVSETWTPTVIEYQKVKQNSFSFKRVNPTSSNVRLQVDSLYYQQTFGSTANVPTVKYKIGENGSWITVPSSQYNIDTTNNKLTVDYTIVNAIDYRNSDTFFVEVSDLLSSWNNKNLIYKGIPVFEFGDDEVQVNGDLLLADINRENVINVREVLGVPSIMTMYLQTNFKLSANNTLYDVTGFAQGGTVGNKLTFNNNRIYVGAGVSKVKVSYSAKIQSVNTTRTFVYLTMNGTNISQEGWWPGASGQQSTVGITSRVLNVDEGDYFNLRCYGTTNTLIVGKGTADFVPTTLTVEVIE